tara:strand:- start:72 stop:404 length:333 start_codon:yes stop_codon:yes gene_type:complete
MRLVDLILNLKKIKNYKALFFIFFFVNNVFVAKAEKDKLHQFYSINSVSYGQYDKPDNQLKIFLGGDSENTGTSFFQDLSLIDDSEYIRDMYKLKLNDMTINKIIYNIEK